MKRFVVWGRGVVLPGLALLLGACGGDGDGPRQRDDSLAPICLLEGVEACRSDDDCGAGSICSENCCLPACATASECDPAGCGPLGCVCDEGACRDRVCSASDECGEGLVCSAGSCVEPASAAEVATCLLSPRYGVLRPGMERRLALQAYGADGEPLPASATTVFDSSEPARVEVDEAGIATGGEEAGVALVTATVGQASCQAELRNHGAPAEDELRVVVVDELTGLPVEGAMVQVETGATPLSVSTDGEGVARFEVDALPTEPRTLSVFSGEHAYLTVVGTGELDLLLPVRRLVPADRDGGFRGSFGPDRLFHPDNVQAGIAGTSIPGNLIDLSFDILIGPSRLTRVTIGSPRDVKIPSGVVLGLGNTWFKEAYQALGTPGVCSDRERTGAGTCGTRTAWGVAGGVPLLDLPIDEITEGGEELEVGELLSQLLPHFQRFRSAVRRDVEFDLLPNRAGEAPDWERFVEVDLQATQRMSLRSTVHLPELPRVGASWLDGAIVFGGAHLADRGVVPLGITAGIDADPAGGTPDGRIDDPDGRSVGELPLRIAPLHGGLEGSDYVVLALAANFAGMSSGSADCSEEDRSGCAAISGLLDRSGSFPFDREVAFDGGFVPPAEATWSRESRTLTLGEAPGAGANVVRVRLSAGGGRVWHVWAPAGGAEVPVPTPAGVEDRAGERASVQALRLEVGLDELARFDERNLAQLVELLSGFSTVELP